MENSNKNINIKMAAISAAILKVKFQKDQVLDGVTWMSSEEILSKINPIFADNNIITRTSSKILMIGNRLICRLRIKFIDVDSGEEVVEFFDHPEWENVPYGATVTMAEKYFYKTNFRIESYDDHSTNVDKWNRDARERAKHAWVDKGDGVEKVDVQRLKDPKTGETVIVVEPSLKGGASLGKAYEATVAPTTKEEAEHSSGGSLDDIERMVKEDALDKGVVIETKKAEEKHIPKEKVEVINTDAADADYRETRNKGWEVKLITAKDDQSAAKELDKLYANLKEHLQVNKDYTDINFDFKSLFTIYGTKATNAQFRKYLIEYRVYGIDRMKEAMMADFGITAENLEALMTKKGPEKKKTAEDFLETEPNEKAHPDITDQPPQKIVGETAIPKGIIMNRQARVDIFNIMPGESRVPMDALKILNSFRAIGIGEEHIKWMLAEDHMGLGIKFPHDQKAVAMNLCKFGTKMDLDIMQNYVMEKYP